MAKDGYYVIAYKLLSYLYSCLKSGEPIDFNVLTCDSKVLKININESYWNYILCTLGERNYLSGIDIIDDYGGVRLAKINRFVEITPEGIDFLESNSAIARAKNILKELKEILPWV